LTASFNKTIHSCYIIWQLKSPLLATYDSLAVPSSWGLRLCDTI